jgi:hypothetical protein
MRGWLLLVACVSCSSDDKPMIDASIMDAGVRDVREADPNCMPAGGSCKTDAGLYQVQLCCSGQCSLGATNTGECQ